MQSIGAIRSASFNDRSIPWCISYPLLYPKSLYVPGMTGLHLITTGARFVIFIGSSVFEVVVDVEGCC